MEGVGDVNATVEDVKQTIHFRGKENDQSLQVDGCSVVGAPVALIPIGNEWAEPCSSMKSPENFTDTLEGQVLLCNTNFSVKSERLSSSPSNAVVEELTLNNYKPSKLKAVESLNRQEELVISRGQWQHLYMHSGVSRVGSSPLDVSSKEPVILDGRDTNSRNIFSSKYPSRNPQESNYGCEDCSRNQEHPSTWPSHNHRGERMANVFSSSGFSDFFARSTLKGKGAMNGNFQPREKYESVNLSSNNKKSFCDGASNLQNVLAAEPDHLYVDGGDTTAAALAHDVINLREWLKTECRKTNKVESLQIFKQILKLVDFAHSQGVSLKDLSPSYFIISSSKKVKYVGSWGSRANKDFSGNVLSNEDHYSRHRLKRRGFMEDSTYRTVSSAKKHQRLGEKNEFFNLQPRPTARSRFGIKAEVVMKDGVKDIRESSAAHYMRKDLTVYEGDKALKFSDSVSDCSKKMQHLSECALLEDKWYSSPESLSDGITMASNIYSLGILLFELFCHFESSEMHATAMSDIRHRILPPYFLSENPKEAGFCLWLLHPEPMSRPRTREILNSKFISETQDLSSHDLSTSSVDEDDAESELMLYFLLLMKEEKQKRALKLFDDIGCLDSDIKEVEKRHSSALMPHSQAYIDLNMNDSSVAHDLDVSHYDGKLLPNSPCRALNPWSRETSLMRDIKQLENVYFSLRSKIQLSGATSNVERADVDVLKNRERFSSFQNDDQCISDESIDHLGTFFDGICKYARYSKFEVLGLLRNVDLLNSANVICSLSFDRDQDYFAAAGVSKKIKIYEFESLLNDAVDIHYPAVEMSSKSKLSCVCWNSYIKNYLASTDYDGVVQLWDASTGQGFSQYKEHQKRAWSVDFSQVDPTKLASGSDDYSVKLWSINEAKCIGTIRNVANVCCVQFSPYSTNFLAFGSADFKIYCYDLRTARIPWCTLSGHGKAVSYVKFLDSCTLVSASTDNTLKIWDLNKTTHSGLSTDSCSLTLNGHTNEKNFVGLSVSDGYIACGSETNEVFAYHKSLSVPVASHNFNAVDSVSGQETVGNNAQFVSSVCWRGKSNMMVAANSNGYIKLLQMV